MSIFSALGYNGPIRVMFNNMPEGSRSSALTEKVQLGTASLTHVGRYMLDDSDSQLPSIK